MSLLGNQNNDFEKKLKKHLGDTEYKPAESLWDRIDKEVNKPEFEQKVEGKIGHYELAPKPETWEYIEANLPPEPKSWKRAGKVWYGIVALLFISGGIIGYQLNNSFKQESAEALAQQQGTDMADIGNQMPVGPEPAADLKENKGRFVGTGTNDKPAKQRDMDRMDAQSGIAMNSPEVSSDKTPVTSTAAPSAYTKKDRKSHLTPSLSVNTQSSKKAAAVSGKGQQNQAAVPETIITNLPATLSSAQASSSKPGVIVSGELINSPDAVAAIKIPVSSTSKQEGADGIAKQHIDETQVKEVNAAKPEPEVLTAKEDTDPLSQPSDTAQPALKNANTGKPIAQVNDSMSGLPFAAIDDQPPVRLSITVMAGIHQSNMKLVAPANMQANKAMRGRVETPEWDFTGGFLLDYKLNERILISSGLILTSFSMGMNYDALPSGRSARLEPGATYENSNDSIVAGSVLSGRIKYSWNEIPLFVTYRFKTTKRFGIEVRGGLSYAIISTVDATMIGQDNIGVLVMKTKESFPVFQNSVFAHLYAGISYKLNETVSLNAMPYFKYSMNSMVQNERWIQQYPWMMGLSMGLRKSF
ncbi:MAG: hypothetical protein V4658_10870 [Bacteroidota bacterium]